MNARVENFLSDQNNQLMIRDADEKDDAQLLCMIAETMPSNGMVLSFERYPSYFQATQVQYHQPEIKIVCLKDQPDVIVAMMNIGFKTCYINTKITQLRYVSDLRIDPNFRGKKTIEMLMDYLYTQLPLDEFLQSVVLKDNHIARHLLHKSRPNFPQPYIHDEITTYTISKVTKPSCYKQFHSQPLTQDWVSVANSFIESMKDHYNFLPHYNLNDLLADDHPFWLGVNLKDFTLIFAQNELVGIMGLWNQKIFKQTKVVEYSRFLKLLRPVYNIYAHITQQMVLPKQQQSFDYLMSHSVLGDPNRGDVFAYQLYQLSVQTKALGKSSFCITLSDDDPRKSTLDKVHAHKMHAIHGLHSFKNSPIGQFDHSKVSYFEVGRI